MSARVYIRVAPIHSALKPKYQEGHERLNRMPNSVFVGLVKNCLFIIKKIDRQLNLLD